MGLYWVLPSFTGFYLVLLGFTEFDWVYIGFYLVLLGFTEFFCRDQPSIRAALSGLLGFLPICTFTYTTITRNVPSFTELV